MSNMAIPVRKMPAPWNLEGAGYISAIKLPPEITAREALPPHTRNKGYSPDLGWLMFMNYEHSGVETCQELQFTPGRYRFADRRDYASVRRMVVSTRSSVGNGRRNRDIREDLARFKTMFPGTTAEVV